MDQTEIHFQVLASMWLQREQFIFKYEFGSCNKDSSVNSLYWLQNMDKTKSFGDKKAFQHPYQHESCCFNMVYAFFLIFCYPSNRNTLNVLFFVFQIAVVNYQIVQPYQQFKWEARTIQKLI